MSRPEKAREREEVWVAMADHFLDTETRHGIAQTALLCVSAGLSAEEARSVWRDEVSPAVALNLYAVAGEWAGWDRGFLIERIEHAGRRRAGPFGWFWRFFDRGLAREMDGVAESIARHVSLLSAHDPPERERMAEALGSLARHAVDFCPEDYAALSEEARARLSALHAGPFWHAMEPSLLPEEREAARQRLTRALEA